MAKPTPRNPSRLNILDDLRAKLLAVGDSLVFNASMSDVSAVRVRRVQEDRFQLSLLIGAKYQDWGEPVIVEEAADNISWLISEQTALTVAERKKQGFLSKPSDFTPAKMGAPAQASSAVFHGDPMPLERK